MDTPVHTSSLDLAEQTVQQAVDFDSKKDRGISSISGQGGNASFFPGPAVVFVLMILFGLVTSHAFRRLQPAFIQAYDPIPFSVQSGDGAEHAAAGDADILHPDYFHPGVIRWERQINRWASEGDLPPDLVAIVMQIESCGDPLARSSAGAMGIFQVMPFHFGSQEDPYDPEVNARRGMAYLAEGYRKSHGDIRLSLAGYNGGHTMIEADPASWPEETRRYVTWGIGIWEDIRAQRYPSPTLEQWFDAGGSQLCTIAAASTMYGAGSN